MTLKHKKIIGLAVILLFCGLFFGALQAWTDEKEPKTSLEQADSLTYAEILKSGVIPGLPPEEEFPTHFQYLNGCFGYAVGHILQHRGEEFDPLDMEKRIEKPREELWGKEWKNRLAKEYNLTLERHKSAETFFKLLSEGEPVVIAYSYPLGGDKWVLHAVAAYSFDQEGVWVSDTLSGKRIRLDYKQVFNERGDKTLYNFTRVVET